jgi:hypothetical protein
MCTFRKQGGNPSEVMTIEGIETDHDGSLVVVHCTRLALNDTHAANPQFLVSTHNVRFEVGTSSESWWGAWGVILDCCVQVTAMLAYLFQLAGAKRAGTYVLVTSLTLAEAGVGHSAAFPCVFMTVCFHDLVFLPRWACRSQTVEFGQLLDEDSDNAGIALELAITSDVRWKILMVPNGDFVRIASQSLRSAVSCVGDTPWLLTYDPRDFLMLQHESDWHPCRGCGPTGLCRFVFLQK